MATTPYKVPLAVASVVGALLVTIGLVRYGDSITATLPDGGEEEFPLPAPPGEAPFICNELPDGGEDCRYCPKGSVNFNDGGVCIDTSLLP